MPKPPRSVRKPGTATRAPTHQPAKPPAQAIVSAVMLHDNPGQLTVPNRLNLGNDDRLYLTRSSETQNPRANPQPISLKESVAWFRLGHDYSLSSRKGDTFSEWLKMIEGALA